ncbi:arginine--tRNA ligase [Candidatus Parcubacteria bacterium]|nr:MAG: arginine--tRNA ligase [Candidatus Parcubacteria bacterium]
MKISEKIKQKLADNIKKTFDVDFSVEKINLVFPPDENLGDYAFECFALAKDSKQSPQQVAEKLAMNFEVDDLIAKVANVGPYLNISLGKDFFQEVLAEISSDKKFGQLNFGKNKKILIEFSGPNTNKPQHVGHARNNCIGQSVVNIYKACGYKVIPVNIINDRGIHIVKSMLAWQEFANGETPQSSGMKGDHLVGKYYVKFGQVLAEEKAKYAQEKNIDFSKLGNIEKRKAEDEFLAQSEWMKKARTMLQAWEKGDKEVLALWEKMNSWVYEGYDKTYHDLGIKFEHLDFESKNYLFGKEIIQMGLDKKILFKKDDGSIWIDLSQDGLDEKLLLRSDGTSVYMTQDIGTAVKRYKKFKFDQGVYVVASEQDYHFKVLFLILEKLGYQWSKNLHHLSYGMVDLPDGKIKSREGKTADADDLIAQMIDKAKEIMSQAEKKVETNDKDKKKIARDVGIGALKFFMLSTNPQKNITFVPDESISFDGYTGTFIQYTHARISTMLKKAGKINSIKKLETIDYNDEEKKLLKLLANFPQTIKNAAIDYNPAHLSQYLFNLAKTYNNFYQHHSVLNAEDENLKQIRVNLSQETKEVLAKGLKLLGIEAPDVM